MTVDPLTGAERATCSDERACQHAQHEVARRLGQESQKHGEACDSGAQTKRPGCDEAGMNTDTKSV